MGELNKGRKETCFVRDKRVLGPKLLFYYVGQVFYILLSEFIRFLYMCTLALYMYQSFLHLYLFKTLIRVV